MNPVVWIIFRRDRRLDRRPALRRRATGRLRDQYRARHRRRIAGRSDLHADHRARFHDRLQFAEPDRRDSRRADADFRVATASADPVTRGRRRWPLCYTPVRFPASVMSHTVAYSCPSFGQSLTLQLARQTRRSIVPTLDAWEVPSLDSPALDPVRLFQPGSWH